MSEHRPRQLSAPLRYRPRAFALRGRAWSSGVGVEQAVEALADRAGLVVLDSAGGDPARYSLVAFDPLPWPTPGGEAPRDLDGLERALGHLRLEEGAMEDPAVQASPFCGGFIGALAYELGVRGEELELPPPVWPAPPVVGGLYVDWLLVERCPGGAARATLFLSEVPGRTPLGERRRAILERLQAAAMEGHGSSDLEQQPLANEQVAGRPTRATRPEVHMARIERTRELIRQGELYQANVCHRMHARVSGTDIEVYRELRRTNPGPYMGLCRFRFDDGAEGALLSSSPELLVEIGPSRRGDGAGRVARTRPIKGTAPRGVDEAEDIRAREELLSSDKDRAELAMIVDLERNDLGRVARAGGVEVEGFPTLESYAAVHHLVADVRARLRPEVTALDVVASLFPGGSITGAPKLRSMEAIAELEGEGRGFFTGSMGFVDVRGRTALNILIRTLVHRRCPEASEVSFHVGGGITWGSDPAFEEAETGHKAQALIRALAPFVEPDARVSGGSDLSGGRLSGAANTQH